MTVVLASFLAAFLMLRWDFFSIPSKVGVRGVGLRRKTSILGLVSADENQAAGTGCCSFDFTAVCSGSFYCDATETQCSRDCEGTWIVNPGKTMTVPPTTTTSLTSRLPTPRPTAPNRVPHFATDPPVAWRNSGVTVRSTPTPVKVRTTPLPTISECEDWCIDYNWPWRGPAPWGTAKCGWDYTCSGCPECSAPTAHPTPNPTGTPTARPTDVHSTPPSVSRRPSSAHSRRPSSSPTNQPTSHRPSTTPTLYHSEEPSTGPSISNKPTPMPTTFPSGLPTVTPSVLPTAIPSFSPSVAPSSSISIASSNVAFQLSSVDSVMNVPYLAVLESTVEEFLFEGFKLRGATVIEFHVHVNKQKLLVPGSGEMGEESKKHLIAEYDGGRHNRPRVLSRGVLYPLGVNMTVTMEFRIHPFNDGSLANGATQAMYFHRLLRRYFDDHWEQLVHLLTSNEITFFDHIHDILTLSNGEVFSTYDETYDTGVLNPAPFIGFMVAIASFSILLMVGVTLKMRGSMSKKEKYLDLDDLSFMMSMGRAMGLPGAPAAVVHQNMKADGLKLDDGEEELNFEHELDDKQRHFHNEGGIFDLNDHELHIDDNDDNDDGAALLSAPLADLDMRRSVSDEAIMGGRPNLSAEDGVFSNMTNWEPDDGNRSNDQDMMIGLVQSLDTADRQKSSAPPQQRWKSPSRDEKGANVGNEKGKYQERHRQQWSKDGIVSGHGELEPILESEGESSVSSSITPNTSIQSSGDGDDSGDVESKLHVALSSATIIEFPSSERLNLSHDDDVGADNALLSTVTEEAYRDSESELDTSNADHAADVRGGQAVRRSSSSSSSSTAENWMKESMQDVGKSGAKAFERGRGLASNLSTDPDETVSLASIGGTSLELSIDESSSSSNLYKLPEDLLGVAQNKQATGTRQDVHSQPHGWNKNYESVKQGEQTDDNIILGEADDQVAEDNGDLGSYSELRRFPENEKSKGQKRKKNSTHFPVSPQSPPHSYHTEFPLHLQTREGRMNFENEDMQIKQHHRPLNLTIREEISSSTTGFKNDEKSLDSISEKSFGTISYSRGKVVTSDCEQKRTDSIGNVTGETESMGSLTSHKPSSSTRWDDQLDRAGNDSVKSDVKESRPITEDVDIKVLHEQGDTQIPQLASKAVTSERSILDKVSLRGVDQKMTRDRALFIKSMNEAMIGDNLDNFSEFSLDSARSSSFKTDIKNAKASKRHFTSAEKLIDDTGFTSVENIIKHVGAEGESRARNEFIPEKRKESHLIDDDEDTMARSYNRDDGTAQGRSRSLIDDSDSLFSQICHSLGYSQGGGSSSVATQRVCVAPPGNLGVEVESFGQGPVVRAVSEKSPMKGTLFPGDRIIALDDVDTRSMTSTSVSDLMIRNIDKRRKITVLSDVDDESLFYI